MSIIGKIVSVILSLIIDIILKIAVFDRILQTYSTTLILLSDLLLK